MLGKERLRIAGLAARGWRILPILCDEMLSMNDAERDKRITNTNGAMSSPTDRQALLPELDPVESLVNQIFSVYPRSRLIFDRLDCGWSECDDRVRADATPEVIAA